jgi:hypothetical protein
MLLIVLMMIRSRGERSRTCRLGIFLEAPIGTTPEIPPFRGEVALRPPRR